MMRFLDRAEAGTALAERLAELKLPDPVVLALPRGGVPVALPVATKLRAPLDLLMVRKLGMPGHEELAAGAVVDGDTPQVVFNTDVLTQAGLRETDFDQEIRQKHREIESRRKTYFDGRASAPVVGRTVVVVDDGIATGATVRAALKGLVARGPARIVLAVPVAPEDSLGDIAPLVDDVVCLATPRPFYAVGAHYHHFGQVTDSEVKTCLAEAERNLMGKNACR